MTMRMKHQDQRSPQHLVTRLSRLGGRALSLLALIGLSGLTQAQPLPDQSEHKHMGVATCASTICHGAVLENDQYDILLNEYITWTRHDAHAKSYQLLHNEESAAIARKLGLENAYTAKICLDCHTDNVAPAQQGPEFQIEDGIGCEACHGGAEKWIKTHVDPNVSYEENVAAGLFPTADPLKRAELCLSCHYGTSDKFATHEIMGAGHPRLSFELDTFAALQPPHYVVDDDYLQRKPHSASPIQWALGQLAAAQAQLKLLQGPLMQESKLFPEIAFYDCHSCHHRMSNIRWQQRIATKKLEPGTVRLNDGHLIMAYVISQQVRPDLAKDLLKQIQNLHLAAAESKSRLAKLSKQLSRSLDQVNTQLLDNPLSTEQKRAILKTLLQLGINGEYHDYIGAEQATMAIDLLLIDLGQAQALTASINALYALVDNDETYKANRFIQRLIVLRDQLF